MRIQFAPLFLSLIACVVGCVASAGRASTASSSSKPNETLISTLEIQTTANLRDAYEAVQRLRPNWLTRAQSEGITLVAHRDPDFQCRNNPVYGSGHRNRAAAGTFVLYDRWRHNRPLTRRQVGG